MPGPKKRYEGYLSLRLEPGLRTLLEEMAGKEERTASQMARILLREAIRTRKVEEAKPPPKSPRTRA
jgi:hypothetical protein